MRPSEYVLDGVRPVPHLAFCANAGVWGYERWCSTIAELHEHGAAVVFTSYNADEAEDDVEALNGAKPRAGQHRAPPRRFRAQVEDACCLRHPSAAKKRSTG